MTQRARGRTDDARLAALAARTWLFVPADAGDRRDKAVRSAADVVVVDLEDAVAPAAKDRARDDLVAWLGAGNRAWVRVNAAPTSSFAKDLDALADLDGLQGLVLPKAEDPGVLRELRRRLGEHRGLVALVESGAGIEAGAALAASGADRLAFGSLDFALDVGCEHVPEALLLARSRLVLDSRVAGLPGPVDGVTTAIDAEAVAVDVRRAKALGFTGKLCIHPAQLAPADEGLRPTADQLAWARQVVTQAQGDGVSAVGGEMVDAPVLRRAERILGR